MRKSFLLFLFFIFATLGISCGHNDYFDEELIYRNDSIIYSNDSVKPPHDTTPIDSIKKSDTTQTDTTQTNNENVYLYEITKYMNQASSGSVQGADCYGDYLFQFKDKNAAVYIYNLKEKKFIDKVTLTANSNNHCNNISFSRVFYHESDEFPLLYVSGSKSGTYNQVQVYRITRDGAFFTIEQIQEVVLPKANQENNLYWTSVAMDNENHYMYVYGNNNGAQIARIHIPNIYQPSVTLENKDILEQFTLEKFIHHQGAVIKDHYLYVFDGVPAWGDTNYLRIIDLKKKRDTAIINIMEKGFKVEPEGTFIYNGELYNASYNSGIYRFKLSNN